MPNKDSIFAHNSLKVRVKCILRSIGDFFDEFIGNPTILGIVVDDVNLRFEELIK